MAPLLFICPKTNQQAPTGIETDVQSLSASWKAMLNVNCPHCGGAHEISVRETYIGGALCFETSPPLQNSCELPVFSAGEVALPRFAGKVVNCGSLAGWEDAKLMQPVRCCAAGRKLGSGLEGGASPVGKEVVTHLRKNRPP